MRRLLDMPKLLPLSAAVICSAVFGCVAGTPATTDNSAGGSTGAGGGTSAGTGGATTSGAGGNNAGSGGAPSTGAGGIQRAARRRDRHRRRPWNRRSHWRGRRGYRRPHRRGARRATGTGGAMTGAGGSPAGLPAFPGADGAGSRIKGGRGGTVYHVTRLDTDYSDVTPGTLRYGLTQLTGPRTIVFDISGVISLGRTAVAGWDSNGNGWDTASRLDIPSDVTIAGQTAPGPDHHHGRHGQAGRHQHHPPQHHLRARLRQPQLRRADARAGGGRLPRFVHLRRASTSAAQNVMIDHVTAVFATDETMSMNELANNITVQCSNISQGQNYPQADAEAELAHLHRARARARCSRPARTPRSASIHNLYAHLKGRLPRVGTESRAMLHRRPASARSTTSATTSSTTGSGTAGTGAGGAAEPEQLRRQLLSRGPRRRQPRRRHQHRAHDDRRRHVDLQRRRHDRAPRSSTSGNLKDINKRRRRQRRRRADRQRLHRLEHPGARPSRRRPTSA